MVSKEEWDAFEKQLTDWARWRSRQFNLPKEPCRHLHTAQLGGGWYQCVDCGATFEG